jgi:eukaryotic-like serine/threonine-protein kinase
VEQKDKLGTKRACMTCGREFDWDTTVCPDDNTPLTALGEEDQLVGSVLADRYEIMEVIGGGGMGLVYKARHRLMNRIVAIKMLHKHMISSKDTLKRFQLEAQAASCLSLPNILTVYDFGLTNEGQPYMVMDYLEGTSLSDLLEAEHHLAPDRAVNIFIQACAGLAHAHQKGVLHRDIKPSNIMLVQFGEQADFVKIVDFGIAKLLNQGVGELTKTGEVYGSPSYMSPEQCRGKETDARSDIYSMGCVMYRTLSGRPLFSGDDIIELLFKQVSEPPAPFDADLNIPTELESVIFKALAKDPSDRYQNMGEYKEALEKFAEKRAGKTTATPTVEGPMPLWKRHGEAAAVPTPKTKSPAPSSVPEVAAAPLEQAPESAARGTNDSKTRNIESTRPTNESKSKNIDQPVIVTPAPSKDESPANRSSSRSASQTLPALDTKHGASSHLRKKMADGNKVLLLSIAGVSIVVLLVVGFVIFRNSQSPTAATASTSAAPEITAHLPDANAQAAFSSGKESFRNKKYDDAKIEFEEALEVTEKSVGPNSPDLVPVLTELALVYRKLDKLALAESSLKRAIPIEEKVGGKNDLIVGHLNFALAQTVHENGRPKDADIFAKKALAILKASLSGDNPQVIEIQTFMTANLPGSGAPAAVPITAPTTAKVEHPAVEHKAPSIAKPPVKQEPPKTNVAESAPPKPENPISDVTPVEATTTVATTHTAASAHHPSHAHHTGTSHKTAAEPPRHRRAYSSYGF